MTVGGSMEVRGSILQQRHGDYLHLAACKQVKLQISNGNTLFVGSSGLKSESVAVEAQLCSNGFLGMSTMKTNSSIMQAHSRCDRLAPCTIEQKRLSDKALHPATGPEGGLVNGAFIWLCSQQ